MNFWRNLSPTKLVVLTALFLALTANYAFFAKVTEIYPWEAENSGFLLSLGIGYVCVLILLMTLLSFFMTTRITVSLFILLAAFVGYFSDQFGTVVDTVMVQNVLETNTAEAADLLNSGFLMWLLLLGILPVAVIWRMPIVFASRRREFRYKAQTAAGSVMLLLLFFLVFSDTYTDFFRSHKPLRFYANPVYAMYSMSHYFLARNAAAALTEISPILPGARIQAHHTGRELVIMVVGEAARSDRFSLNGYSRDTNPMLATETDLVSYSSISSCGTSTAVSLPCMFSIQGRAEFDQNTEKNHENVLDVLQHAGINILWRDNNSGSKKVAERINFENFTTPELNPVCDVECRDLGMLDGLQEYINGQDGDILIILHQMGNHGPAYFKRYPAEFEIYTPACHSEELSDCTDEEIGNAYDNAILYTDHFLSRVVAFLKDNTPKYETAMLDVSDHGESLGEKGLYLHGMPYVLAPAEQTEVPVILWVGESSDIDYMSAYDRKDLPNSHDTIFYSLLSAFEIDALPPVHIKPLFSLKSS